MVEILLLLLILMILGALIALEAKDLVSSVISLGITGFSLVLIFLFLQAPDLAIVQIVVETLSLVILLAAILKTTRVDITQRQARLFPFFGLAFLVLFMLFVYQAFKHLPAFGQPLLRMAGYYLKHGLEVTGAANLVTAVILDFRGYDTLGEATVLFTAVIGVVTVLRKTGRKK